MENKFIHELDDEEKIQAMQSNLMILAVAAAASDLKLMKVKRKDTGEIKYLAAVDLHSLSEETRGVTIIAEMIDKNPMETYYLHYDAETGEFKDLPNATINREHTVDKTFSSIIEKRERTANEHFVQSRKFAIEDAISRIQSNPNDWDYVAQQQKKIKTWEDEIRDFQRTEKDGDGSVV